MKPEYFMPGEWEEHRRCWMAWPTDSLAWRGRHLEVKREIAKLANIISDYEPLSMIVPASLLSEATEYLNSNVTIIEIENNDSWVRDTAPTFVKDSSNNLCGVDWIFNGWGDMEYANYDKDKDLASEICKSLGIKKLNPGIVNEGGAIHVDGDGTLICTRATLQNINRNPEVSEKELEDLFTKYLGVTKTVWLDEGFTEDETGGHIDIICSFSAPGRLMIIDCEDEQDLNYHIFKKNIEELEKTEDAQGRKLKLIRVPQPEKKIVDGRRLDYTYLNFYIANGAVIVPQFNDPADLITLEIFSQEFPDREIIPFNAEILFHGGGGIHCLTQQEPLIKGYKE